MLKLDRTKPYSVVNGSIRGLEQNGVLFNNNGDPFYPDKEEMRLEEERKRAAEKAEKEREEKERKIAELELREKVSAEQKNKPQRRRPGRPPKKKEVHRGTVLEEKKKMPEMEIPQPFDFSPGKDFNNEGK